MSVEIEEMLRRYGQELDRLAPLPTAAEVRARAEQLAAGEGAARGAPEPNGHRRERGYLVEPEHSNMITFTGQRARRRRVIVALAVAALIIACVAVVTRHGASNQREIVPPGRWRPARTPFTDPPTTARTPTTTTGAFIPTVTITPSTGLTDGWIVHAVGRGYVPGVTYTARECVNKGAAINPSADCVALPTNDDSAKADSTGTVSIYIQVSASTQEFGSDPFAPPPNNCTVAPGCVVRVGNGEEAAIGTISFVPIPVTGP